MTIDIHKAIGKLPIIKEVLFYPIWRIAEHITL